MHEGGEVSTRGLIEGGARSASAGHMATDLDQAQVVLEQRLVRRAARGDQNAFVTLASTQSDLVYAIARNLSSSDAEALDLTQAAFQEAWNELHAMVWRSSFRTFVCRFLVRKALARLQRVPPTALDRAPQDGSERVREALGWLDAEDRAAFVLRIVAELSVAEMAEILEIPAPVVRRRVHSACLLMTGYAQNLAAAAAVSRRQPAWMH